MKNDQRDYERTQAGHELAQQVHRERLTRDIVDMAYDDGLTPKEALEIEKAYRQQLAHDFRKALEGLHRQQPEMER